MTDKNKLRRPYERPWFPVECMHGFDCCPFCDGERRDPETLDPISLKPPPKKSSGY